MKTVCSLYEKKLVCFYLLLEKQQYIHKLLYDKILFYKRIIKLSIEAWPKYNSCYILTLNTTIPSTINAFRLRLFRMPTRVELWRRNIISYVHQQYCVWCFNDFETTSRLYVMFPKMLEMWINNLILWSQTSPPKLLLRRIETKTLRRTYYKLSSQYHEADPTRFWKNILNWTDLCLVGWGGLPMWWQISYFSTVCAMTTAKWFGWREIILIYSIIKWLIPWRWLIELSIFFFGSSPRLVLIKI